MVLAPNQKPGVNKTVLPLSHLNHGQQKVRDMLQQQQAKPKPAPAKPAAGPAGTFEVCEICGGYVKDKMSLRVHFFYAHKIDMPIAIFNRPSPPMICDVCKQRFWTTQGITKHKNATGHMSGVSGPISVTKPAFQPQCWICFKECENLYNHLTRFHKLGSGECMALKRCMFCGIHHSGSKKDLEAHLAKAHGVMIKPQENKAKLAPKTAATTSTTSIKGGMVRNNFCVFCSVQFADNTQLTLHCLNSHATCSTCGMVVASQVNLKSHVCRAAQPKNCHVCGKKGITGSVFIRHMKTHTKKCSVHLKRLSTAEIAKATKRRKVESSDENGDVEIIAVETKPEPEPEDIVEIISEDESEKESEEPSKGKNSSDIKEESSEPKVIPDDNETNAEKNKDEDEEEKSKGEEEKIKDEKMECDEENIAKENTEDDDGSDLKGDNCDDKMDVESDKDNIQNNEMEEDKKDEGEESETIAISPEKKI